MSTNTTYMLADAFEMHKKHPTTFHIPHSAEIEMLRGGHLVKLSFLFGAVREDGCAGERMWVIIKEQDGDKFVGRLANDPSDPDLLGIRFGDKVHFESKHIIGVGHDPQGESAMTSEELRDFVRPTIEYLEDHYLLTEYLDIEYALLQSIWFVKKAVNNAKQDEVFDLTNIEELLKETGQNFLLRKGRQSTHKLGWQIKS